MDVLAHGLWAFALFQKHKQRWWAAFFGVAPDLFAFTIFFFARLVNGSGGGGRPELAGIPEYVFILYNISHSLVVFGLVFFLVYLITRKWWLPLLGWALHILIDIPTHTRAFFPTPFLWPLNDWKVSGISWGDPAFMVINYFALLSVYFFIFMKWWKRKSSVKHAKKI